MAERVDKDPDVTHPARKRDPVASSGPIAKQDPVLDLQRQAGNRAVSEMLQGGPAGTAAASPALRLRDALRAGRGVVQRELSLDVQRDMKSDKEDKEGPTAAEDKFEPAEEKMPSDSTDKLGGEEKMPSDSTDKLGGEEKMPSDSTDKLPDDEEQTA